MIKLHLIATFIFLFTLGLQAQTSIVDFGSTWKYYDLGDEPPKIMGNDFFDANYNDNTWASGPAQLGYGDGDEATVITSTANGSNLRTAYFRLDFNVADPNAFPAYEGDLLYDDGAVVYLNGTEIFRTNISDPNPTYNTFAGVNNPDNDIKTFNIAPSDLVVGNNTLAVEVHQRTSNSSDISFDLSIASTPVIVRGPYIQKLTPTSAVVKWRTAFPAESTVRYGLSQNTAVNSASDPVLKIDHEIEITGLASNRKYFYYLQDGATTILPAAADLTFITAPPIGTVQPVTAWILGDPGTGNNNARAVRDAYYNYIGTDHTDMMLFLGDNAYNNGTDAEFQSAVFENMYEDKLKNTVSWSCLGNHDGRSADSGTQTGVYYDIYDFPTNGEAGGVASGTEAYYSFDYANIHFIVLDSYETDNSVGGAMYNWAEMDIQNTTQDWIVAFWHHPAYTKGSHNSDTEGELIRMRERFVPMLELNGVDLVLSGHSHSYERSYFVNGHYGNSTTFDETIHTVGPNGYGDGQLTGDGMYQKDLCSPGSVYITTGSAGKITGNGSLNHPVFHYSAKSLGSAVMEVNGNQLDIKFVRETGAIDDFFSIEKGNFGFPCDDGDSCTIDDIVDASCNCVGTLLPPTDSDNDGTDDCMDGCPNDPLKIEPGICGCDISDTQDTDGDGTIDCIDDCPNDPLKTAPGICGCGVSDMADADGDNTPDCVDGCPNDQFKTDPGICGCGSSDADSDSDGTVDCLDGCATDPMKIAPGICGCGTSDVDADSDSTPDCIDDCPNDPLKTAPGICGCGFDDTADTDQDGTIDCQDDCPNDPLKTTPGICGCGFDDTADADQDGTIDCQDGCPNDPLKTATGICGCGISDTTDTDQDGTIDCQDGCPNDSLKTVPGICGCGISDTQDTDQDGTIDCQDGCPNDPLKTAPQLCGCGNSDIDVDQNGICDLDEDPCAFLDFENFETSSGIWTPAGSSISGDAERVMSTLSPQGDYSMRIRDNSGINSAVVSDVLDLSQVDLFNLVFEYQTSGFNPPQSFFLEISTDGGTSFTIINQWVSGTDFNNNVVYQETVELDATQLNSTTAFRFVSNGSINSDKIFLDNIELQSCPEPCTDYNIFTDNATALMSEDAIIGIETNRVIELGSDINHNAGEYVLLNPGFEVKSQAMFHAFIEACQ